MFEMLRKTRSRTVDEALQKVELHASMFLGDDIPLKGTDVWAARLYDLAHFLETVRIDLAFRELTPTQAFGLRLLGRQAAECLKEKFYGVAPMDAISAAFDGLELLMRHAAGETQTRERDEHRNALADLNWLENIVHNEYLAWHRANRNRASKLPSDGGTQTARLSIVRSDPEIQS
ncbi:hypothetical protein ACFQFQ_17860 [Sulfitobacter porphyrae]|uniref:Uncharacterized protein n=1 Tax=Sulfitobacter porphyrae TaxID=1246864 RepID=A0ABW2B5B0_9RHOB